MLSPEQLLQVASAYARATGLSLVTVGRWSCGNDKIFGRIGQGRGATSRSIIEATTWFQANWPPHARWPRGVDGAPRKKSRKRAVEPTATPEGTQ
jgi:hypothetical protein